MVLRTFGLIWSDVYHRFFEPIPINQKKVKEYQFPDAILYAENKEEAIKAVDKINEKFKDVPREEMPSVFYANKI